MSRRKKGKLGEGIPTARLGITTKNDAGPGPGWGAEGSPGESREKGQVGHLARGLPPLGQKDGQQSSVAHQYEAQARGLEQLVCST